MAFLGMIVEEVEQLAAQMEQRVQEIENLRNVLTQQLEGAHWVGPDREQFHSDWTSVHIPSLVNVENGLKDAAAKARLNAQQQQEASQS